MPWHDAQDQQRNGELEASVKGGEKKNGTVANQGTFWRITMAIGLDPCLLDFHI